MKDVDTRESCWRGYWGPPVRRLLLDIAGAIAIYGVSVAAVILWLKFSHPAAPWKYIIVALLVFPALLFPAAQMRYFRAMDELQRKIMLEGTAFGFILAAMVTLAYGLMEPLGLRHLPLTQVWTVMWICWTVGVSVAYVRYR